MKNFSLNHKKTGVIFLSFGIFGSFVVVMYMIMWSNFKYHAANQISGINYLAYFTFLANILLFVWLILAGIAILTNKQAVKKNLFAPKIFCGIALYVILVGIIFYGALRWMVTPFPWNLWYARLSDFFFHGLSPIMTILLFVYMKKTAGDNKEKIRLRHVTFWLIFPLLYFAFSLIRGFIIDWFAYPFFDPNWDFAYALPIPSWLYIILITILFSALFYLAGFFVMKIWNYSKITSKY
ncbi:MAG: Pr6Pr family membrane protein [Firmicutes bacterium]|nr:Pr6Pr family membrane protein [Bacillota bacterium]